MTAWRRGAIAALVFGTSLAAIAVWKLIDSAGGRDAASSVRGALAVAKPASTSFAGLTATRLRVGTRCLDLVVADTLAEREQGLRERRDVGSYDGMLFVFDGPTEVGFTMSTVPVALDIGFYDASGAPVSHQRMAPCVKAEAECPVYRSDGPFQYALETLPGGLPHGALGGPCSG